MVDSVEMQEQILRELAAGRVVAAELALRLGLSPLLFVDDRPSPERSLVYAAMGVLLSSGAVQFQFQPDMSCEYWTGWLPEESGSKSPIITEVQGYFRSVSELVPRLSVATPCWNVLQFPDGVAVQYDWDDELDAGVVGLIDHDFSQPSPVITDRFWQERCFPPAAVVAEVLQGVWETRSRLHGGG